MRWIAESRARRADQSGCPPTPGLPRRGFALLAALGLGIGLAIGSIGFGQTPEAEAPRPGPPASDDFERDEDADGLPDDWYNARDVERAQGGPVGPTCLRFQNERPGRPARISRAFGADGRVVEALVVGLWVKVSNTIAGERVGEQGEPAHRPFRRRGPPGRPSAARPLDGQGDGDGMGACGAPAAGADRLPRRDPHRRPAGGERNAGDRRADHRDRSPRRRADDGPRSQWGLRAGGSRAGPMVAGAGGASGLSRTGIERGGRAVGFRLSGDGWAGGAGASVLGAGGSPGRQGGPGCEVPAGRWRRSTFWTAWAGRCRRRLGRFGGGAPSTGVSRGR